MLLNASECAQHVADGRSRSRNAQGPRMSCMPARLAIFFFFGSADPRIFEDSNGSSADPDRSGFRWIRFTPSEYVIVHTIWGGSPVILWISLGGKPKWLPLKFGYHDEMRTSPVRNGDQPLGKSCVSPRFTDVLDPAGPCCASRLFS